MFANLKDGNDVGVIQSGCRLSLGVELFDVVGACKTPGENQQLDWFETIV